MTKKLCIYHANCLDGFGAAWAFRQAFINYPTVQFHASVMRSMIGALLGWLLS